jgi:two-component system chemotaxis sensor kinase CheA
MDVVRMNVTALRGRVEVRSTPGEGTTVILRLPFTVAIINAFVVDVAGQLFGLPMDDVEECVDGARLAGEAAEGIMNFRGEALPYVRLRALWKLASAPPTREDVVVRHDGGRAGLVVDALHGSAQTVIKPLGRVLDRTPGIAGSAITGAGQIALIVDVPALLSGVSRARAAAQASNAGRR